MPAEGLAWSLPKKNVSLHLVGQRQTMILIDFIDHSNSSKLYHIEIYDSVTANKSITAIVLNPPSNLPPTESNGTRYSNTSYSARIAAKYIKPGMKVRVSSDESGISLPNIGQNSTMRLQILPFYWFGANSSNSIPFNKIKTPDNATIKELYETWPVSALEVLNHPIGKFEFPFAIIPPSDGGHAYRITNSDQKRSGYVLMDLILSILAQIKSINGESKMNSMLYAPIMALNSKNQSVPPYGGLGSTGGFRSTGDWTYRGVFIHENGHGWGLPHSGDGYTKGVYPYVNGSLFGSQWGFNFNHNEFLSIYLPKTSEHFKNCNESRVMKNGKCVKQDPMQGGAKDLSSSYKFSMFPDFDIGVMQENMEGLTTVNGNTHSIRKGLLHYDTVSGAHLQWDSIDKKYVKFEHNFNKEFDSGLPMLRNVDVYTIIMQYNNGIRSNCTECSAIYPIVKCKGNLMRYIDPTDSGQLKLIHPINGQYKEFCSSSGCDFTIRVTYKDNTKFFKLIPKGIRSSNKPSGAADLSKTDPKSSGSLLLFVENIPAHKELSRIELLWTPFGFNSTTPSVPTILLSQIF